MTFKELNDKYMKFYEKYGYLPCEGEDAFGVTVESSGICDSCSHAKENCVVERMYANSAAKKCITKCLFYDKTAPTYKEACYKLGRKPSSREIMEMFDAEIEDSICLYCKHNAETPQCPMANTLLLGRVKECLFFERETNDLRRSAGKAQSHNE